MKKEAIQTSLAPKAIGTYSQAVKVGDQVFFSGQIALDPASMELTSSSFEAEAHQVFKNVCALCDAAGGGASGVIKLNIYLTDLGYFSTVNEIMALYFSPPYPARAAIGVAALPKGARIEVDGVLIV